MKFSLRQTLSIPFASFQEAKIRGTLSFWIISAIAAYTPFEDFLVGWLPIPQVAKYGVRFIPEIFLYTLLFNLIYRKIRLGEKIRKTPIDILIIAFFLSSFISIIVNHASIPGSVANLRTNWRYLSVYYLLVNLDISQQQLASIIKKIIAIGIIQSVITFFQFFLPPGFRVAMSGGYCDKALTKRASCGTFFDSAILSGFMLIIKMSRLELPYLILPALVFLGFFILLLPFYGLSLFGGFLMLITYTSLRYRNLERGKPAIN